MTPKQASILKILTLDDRAYITPGRGGHVAPHLILSNGDQCPIERRLFEALDKHGWLHKVSYSFGWRYTASQDARDILAETDPRGADAEVEGASS